MNSRISRKKNDNIMFPEVLPPLQQEFKSWHDKLSHIHPKSTFRLAKPGPLPKKNVSPCASCMFGTERRRKWITKGNTSGSIRKYNGNKLGDAV